MSAAQPRGLALWCKADGEIVSIIASDLDKQIAPGQSFYELVDPGSVEKSRLFLRAVRDRGIAVDWELNLLLAGQVVTFHATGIVVEGRLLLLVAHNRAQMWQLYEELSSINNEQGNLLRAAFKAQDSWVEQYQQSVQANATRDDAWYDQISRLNNELVNLQRELTKKNTQLALTLTELQAVQTQLVQQEQLAAVGQLAAGIAHDFNNILNVIQLNAEIALPTPGLLPKVHERLETIVQHARHAADLVQQLLDFGRRSILQSQPLDLVTFLQEQARVWQHILPEQIHLDLSCAVAQATIQADPSRLQQLLLNLVFNARAAMPQGGELQIRLTQFLSTSPDEVPVSGMAVGAWVQLSVRDTGGGIAPEVQPHIFEPFFTTKAPGQGSGLGLAQVYGIVKQHQGHIVVQSQVGAGTTFTIYLPMLV